MMADVVRQIYRRLPRPIYWSIAIFIFASTAAAAADLEVVDVQAMIARGNIPRHYRKQPKE